MSSEHSKHKILLEDKHNLCLVETINYFLERTEISNVIYIGRIDKKAIANEEIKGSVTFIGNSSILNSCNTNNLTIIDYNVNDGLPNIEKSILKKSLVIVDSVIENMSNPGILLRSLSAVADQISVILISTKHSKTVFSSQGYTMKKFKKLMKNHDFLEGFYGYIPDYLYSEKTEVLYIGGTWSNFSCIEKPLDVCAIISTYNEEDIIEQVCKYLLNQGIDVHIIDNWSTDSTLEIVKSLMEEYSGISYEIFPEKKHMQFVWFEMLNRKVEYAKANDYDWYIHYDADEIRESPWECSLIEGIQRVDQLGYNAIDHTVIDFRPVRDRFNEINNPEEYFKYFEFGRRPGHFAQVKAWKNIAGVDYDLSSTGGHSIIFQGIKIFPYKFLLKHYPLRSLEQMQKKIFKERLPRFKKEKKERGWHTHYDKYMGKEESLKLWKESDLLEFNEDFYEEYLLERLFGINIKREQ